MSWLSRPGGDELVFPSLLSVRDRSAASSDKLVASPRGELMQDVEGSNLGSAALFEGIYLFSL
jgi:hypothetical protein